ncbi:formimidoylglutamase [Arthrobacter sp. H14-L1]|uniref:formimidoylglutamase n=1 Tax=Arthrobacter sp. H14-L1 TaxID=2996697 RepID=UPI00226F157A|nr:formimidoylglutamase [Arthrobacter sp. H14-L1]MCY0905989.1 formimidoylglutamase [Arthrobacter sp. H14-L1]
MKEELSPRRWTGRDDGPALDHRRWHHAINLSLAHTGKATPGIALLGFQSDEGVRRNMGRVGAATAPDTIRSALASLSAPAELMLHDLGDVSVTDSDLESGQARLGKAVTAALAGGHLPIVLGGGHETAYGSYLGLCGVGIPAMGRLGIINLDAHFDLRADPVPSSGTPFLQIATSERSVGRDFNYTVIGISEPNNTVDLVQTAADLGVRYLRDEECSSTNQAAVNEFVDDFLSRVDAVYLTIDLDVLPAHVAPGVSAPAALGVPYRVILAVCRRLARSPKLVHVDVVELNPRFDIDDQTARSAARLIHAIATEHAAQLGKPTAIPASTNQPGIEFL